MKKTLFWVLSFLITASFAVYQRRTGPTYPIKGGEAGTSIYYYYLPRSCTTGANDCLATVSYKGPLEGRVEWRRYKTQDPVQSEPLAAKNERLFFYLPSQPPAGKLEYRVFVKDLSGERELSPGPVVTRFKGPVPAWALIPHIIFLFFFMFFSVRIALTALAEQTPLKHAVVLNLGFLLLGGFVFGPIVQHYAFGQAWTGFPFGYDLTDNKTLLMLLAWLPALWAVLRERPARRWVLLAFVVTMAVYLVPHSMFGSELDYAKGEVITGK